MEKRKENCSLLETDFKQVEKDMELWQEKREKKGAIYYAFSEYILCLENSLEHETDSYKRYLIEKEIKELKKEQKKYYVPSILEMASYDLVQEHRNKMNEKRESTLEKASPQLIKQFRSMKERKCGNNNGESSIN